MIFALRVRNDKGGKSTDFVTANKIWKTINNPVTEELITGIEDLSDLSLFKMKDDDDDIIDDNIMLIRKKVRF